MTKFYKLLMAIVFAACCAFSGWAYDFEEGGLYYNISGTNVALATGDNSYEGDIVIPATVEHDGVTYNVTTVGTVFKNNTTVTKLKLPSSVTTLPESCFAGMTGLLELEIPNVATLPNYLCDGCTALTTLILGEGVHLASCHMTRSCNSLNKVYMLYEDVLGWDSPSGGIGGSTIPAQYKPIANNLQAQSTLYIPNGTTDAYKTKKNIGYGTVTLWNKFGSYVELPPPGGGVDVESITITPANPVLAAEEGATVQLTATVLPEDATDKTIVWSTSDANVATVSNTGLVTRTAPLINDGDQPYTVTITANGANDVSASVTITAEVLANIPVSSIAISPENPVLAAEAGATVQLTATVLPEDALDKTITWSSANETVATVNANGLVTRVAPLINDGDQPFTVNITATAASGVTQTVTVTAEVLANIPVTSVTITPENPVLAAENGATVQLTATPLPENALDKTITWSSADETIATVNASGLVTRVAPLYNNNVPFTVNITATAASGVTQTVTVTAEVLETVYPTALSISPADPVLTAEAGSTVQLTAVFDPETTTERTVTWNSADETVATVDANGLVTRTAPLTNEQEQPYTVVITATTPNGLSANVTVTANIKGDEFFYEDGLYYNVLSHDDLTVEVTNSKGGTGNDIDCYSGDIEIPVTVTHKGRTYQVIQIGNYAFGASGTGFSAGTSVTSLKLNEGLRNIASYGIRGMGGISELVLPSTITHLVAFALGRISAETIVIPNAAEIEQSALSGCTNLKHLILGAGVQNIGNNFTNGVTGVEDVTCLATTPPVWDGGATNFAPFAGFINNATLYVPEGCIEAYRNAKATYSGTTTYYWRFGTIEEYVEPAAPQRVHITETEHGTIEADNMNPEDGATVTLTVTPETGYSLESISAEAVINPENSQAPRRIDGPSVGVPVTLTTIAEGQTYTFVMPDAPYEVIITTVFALTDYTITVAEGIENGTVAADKQTANYGEAVNVTVTPAAGYELATLTYTVEGEEPVDIVNNTFNMPAANVTINATFSAIDYTITVDDEIENGTVEADKQTANIGETVTLTITPAEGYSLGSLTVLNGETTVETTLNQETGEYTFTMPAANVTVTATFTNVDYTITVVDGIENGTVEAPATAHFGETVNVTVTPATGYQLASLTYTVEGEEAVNIENNTFNMPAANVTINATFSMINYTITVDNEIENGTVEAPATANYGDAVNVTVTPDTGYQL
ncbi:MAG: Ig-like domain-containing protein, partial [Muribaculaceae bacterium]|nr:Ig-like domain-containing protein [Muribaculaceae bacterium]